MTVWHEEELATLHLGDCLEVLAAMEPDSADLIVTSPPYFALRSYTDGGEHYEGQIGSEATPQAFLEALWAVTAECVRVLKPSGSIFVNLGDKYAGSGGHNNSGLPGATSGLHAKAKAAATVQGEARESDRATRRNAPDSYNKDASFGDTEVRAKSLMLLPQRYAIGCIDQLGLILRAEVIWSKPNCLSGGTVVYARTKGRERTIKVHDLCRHYQPEDVQLWNGQQWTQVVWWQPTDRAEGAQVEIEFRNGQRVGCTNEHRWPVLGKGNVAASDLAPGDVIESCGTPEGTKRPERVDDAEIGWFVGLYIAEGSRSGTTIQIASHADETARYKRLTALAESFGENCAAHVTSANGMTINLTGRFLDAILSTFVGGKDAYTKHLRPEAWTRSNRFLRAVLEGYLDGDGHDNGAGRWTVGFTGRNDDLAADLRALGARLGASVRLRRGTTTGFGQEWPTWTGTIYFDASRRKRPDAEVVAIRPSRARRFWDIGVEDDPHLFALASGVLTHNSLPESVTDRVRRSHEQWFHFTKEPRYFSAVDEVREPQTGTAGMPRPDFEKEWISSEGGTNHRTGHSDPRLYNPLGKLPSSVWQIPTEPLRVPDHLGVDHFAAFPSEWPRRIILGWSPSGVCVACGEGRRPVVEKELAVQDRGAVGSRGSRFNGTEGEHQHRRMGKEVEYGSTEASITGYACACPDTTAPTRPAVVLDPFAGTGTTVAVAKALGRHGVGIDMSEDYLRLARWRIDNIDLAVKVAERSGMAAPAGEHDGMIVSTLFGET